MPTACPFTAAITGLRIANAGGSTPDALNSGSSRRAKVSPAGARSAPAQKASPAPVSTTARTASSRSHAA